MLPITGKSRTPPLSIPLDMAGHKAVYLHKLRGGEKPRARPAHHHNALNIDVLASLRIP